MAKRLKLKGLNLPNILTLSRIALIPVMVAAFYLPSKDANWVLVSLFAYASITDFLDGFIARQWDQISALGRFLDPLADKLLVAAILLMLVGIGRITGINLIPAVVILCREILVSGLREFLAGFQQKIPVSYLAKWKTTLQMLALLALLSGVDFIVTLGIFILWIAAILTLASGYDYLRKSLKHV